MFTIIIMYCPSFYYYVVLYLIFIDSPHEISPEQIRVHPLMDKIAYFKECIMVGVLESTLFMCFLTGKLNVYIFD